MSGSPWRGASYTPEFEIPPDPTHFDPREWTEQPFDRKRTKEPERGEVLVQAIGNVIAYIALAALAYWLTTPDAAFLFRPIN